MDIFLFIVYIYFTTFFKVIDCTVDVNLAELEYIANQLTPMECENLDKYLHSSTYEVTSQTNFFSFGERTCLEILIHWNSSPNEGLGETHSILSHRLKQIGRKDLADWLSNIVFQRLSTKLNKTVLANPFKEVIVETSEIPEAESSGNNSDLSFYHGEPDWETYDTVAILVAFFLLIAIVILICELCGCCKSFQKKKKKVKISKNKKYKLLTEEGSSSCEDSAVKS
nr:uncharacterized protein LOC112211381 [Halyomorpha halys]